MLKKHGPVYLISFHTTADAIALERVCKGNNCPGRLLPVPRSITSDCGIAWSSPLCYKKILDVLIASNDLDYAGKYELEKL